MIRILHLATAAIFALALLGAHSAHADSSTEPPLDELIAKAKKQGKPLVIDFYAVWCSPCKQFAKNVLPRPDVQNALTSVIFAKYDAEHGHGVAAAKRYNVTGYPTFVVVDGNGTAQVTNVGSMVAANFIDFVQSATMAVLDEPGVQRLLASKASDPRTLLAAARWYRARGDWSKADRVYRRTVAADKGNAGGFAAKAAWECMQLQRYHAVRAKVVRQASYFAGKYPASSYSHQEFLTAAHSGTLTKARVEKLGQGLVRAHWDNAGMLNGLTYRLLSAGAFDAALDSAKRQVELLPKQPNPLDTLAEVYHYRRDRDQAIAASQRGIALLPKNAKTKAIFAANLKRFSATSFAPVDDVARETRRAKTRLARLPGVDPYAQKLPKAKRTRRPPSARMVAFANFRKAFSVASKACKRRAGKLTEVYVRLEFSGKAGKVKPTRVVVLEPTAPRRLKRCIAKSLRAVEFNDLPSTYRKRYTSRVAWAKKKKVQPWKPTKKSAKNKTVKKPTK